MQVPFSGDAIVPTNNSNWPLLNDKAINTAMDKAALINDPTSGREAWGKIDDDGRRQAAGDPVDLGQPRPTSGRLTWPA